MKKYDTGLYKEFLDPRHRFFDFWMRMALSAIFVVMSIIIVYTFLRPVFQYGDLLNLIPLFFIIPIFSILDYWIISDFIKRLRYPISIKSRGKIYITKDDIIIAVGRIQHKRIQWKDVEVLEKAYYFNDKVILIITNPLEERVVKCNNRMNNYIMIPAKISLETAISTIVGRKVSIADPTEYRFVK